MGVLLFNYGGLRWTPANTEDVSAQEHAAEVLAYAYLRGNRERGTPLDAAVQGIRDASAGDATEDQPRVVPPQRTGAGSERGVAVRVGPGVRRVPLLEQGGGGLVRRIP